MGRARNIFSRIPYLGGVSLAALRFGASFGPDRDKRCGRCRTGRLAWWGVFVANDDKGTRVPALRDLCIVVCFLINGKLGAQKKKLGADLLGSVLSALWVDNRTGVRARQAGSVMGVVFGGQTQTGLRVRVLLSGLIRTLIYERTYGTLLDCW